MVDGFNNFVSSMGGLGLYSWLPEPLPSVLSGLIGVILSFAIISLVVKLVGSFL